MATVRKKGIIVRVTQSMDYIYLRRARGMEYGAELRKTSKITTFLKRAGLKIKTLPWEPCARYRITIEEVKP